MAIVSVWTPLAFERIAVRWFSLPNCNFARGHSRPGDGSREDARHSVSGGNHIVPVGLSRASDLELPVSSPAIGFDLAGRSIALTQIFTLLGTLVMLPIILGYVVFVCWIFGGKLRARPIIESVSLAVAQCADRAASVAGASAVCSDARRLSSHVLTRSR
jgi:cytochrome d ubiquinol oxidase subunit II